MAQRIDWDALPGQLKDAVTARTGPIAAAQTMTAGLNSPLAAVLDTAAGQVFVKGLPSDHRRVTTQDREAAVAPLVTGISPGLLWHFDEAGWNVLGYQYAPGRHANYRPGSPDLDQIVQLMEALGQVEVPPGPGPLKRAEDRWKTYVADPGDALAFAGHALTHTDWAPDNVLIAPDRPWLIDWAWPTLGAAWTDPACWLLRLMGAGGHTAASAERQAGRVAAFAAADPAHVSLFANASVRMWEEIEQVSPSDWTAKMAHAARDWHAHRLAR